jgi:hypothetical protein
MRQEIWLAGSLKDHPRGRRLADLTGAKIATAPEPGSRICLFFGNEFQKLDKALQSDWLDWSQTPGSVFLLLPPFLLGPVTTLLDWEVLNIGPVLDSMTPPMTRRLSGEVRLQFKGAFQVPAKPAGAWDNGTVNTCFYRRHPHSGLFAATCLPLWSLALLDAKADLQEWLADLSSLAGNSTEDAQKVSVATLDLRSEHYALLLHLCSDQFSSSEEAIKALSKSEFFRLPAFSASRYLSELETQGLAKAGSLTRAGRSTLAESSYQPYAAELEVLNR